MRGKVLINKLIQKQYKPIVWIKDANDPSGKSQVDLDNCTAREDAEEVIADCEIKYDVFFSDIKETTVEVTGEFYIDRGYYS